MSKNNSVDKVSRKLQEKRNWQAYKHTRNERKYDAEIWNTNDVQFFALWQERHWSQTHRRDKHTVDNLMVSLDLFVWWQSAFHNSKEKLYKKGTFSILPEQTASLRDFLVNKPTDETFTVPWGRYGNFHLSFKKRGLFGPMELNWKFQLPKERWDATLFLPAKKRIEERKYMKKDEERQNFWFSYAQVDKLASYLNFIIP